MDATCNLTTIIPSKVFVAPQADSSRVGAVAFVSSLIVIALLATWQLWRVLPVSTSNVCVLLLWTAGFFTLSLNTAYMLLTSIIAGAFGPKALPEADLSHCPGCDLVFIVKDEPASVLENLEVSLRQNLRTGVRLVLISNSTDEAVIEAERRAILHMQARYGPDRANHWQPPHNPTGRKHTALHQWLREGPAGEYCFVCDADSVVPDGAIERLLRKAEHPANADVAVFQGQIRTSRAETRFSNYLRFGAELSQRVYMVASQRALGCSPFFGHGALIRRDAFKWIRLPASILSHDIWEMAVLSRRGFRVAFCHNVHTFEATPSNYLEVLRRDHRWAEGTLQSLAVLRLRGLSLAAWFYTLFAVYNYIAQLVFLLWFLLGFLMCVASHSTLPVVLQPLMNWGAGAIVFDGGGMYLPVLLIVFLHRLPFCQSLRESAQLLMELLASTLILLNGLVYSSIAVLASPFGKRAWIPMRKGRACGMTFGETVAAMAPSLFLGLVLLLGALISCPGWLACAAPIVASLVLGPFAAWFTSQPITARAPKTERGDRVIYA